MLFHFPLQASSLIDRKECERSSCWATFLNDKPIISINHRSFESCEETTVGLHLTTPKILTSKRCSEEFQLFRKTFYGRVEIWFRCGSWLPGVTQLKEEKIVFQLPANFKECAANKFSWWEKDPFLLPLRVDKMTRLAGKRPLWEFILLVNNMWDCNLFACLWQGEISRDSEGSSGLTRKWEGYKRNPKLLFASIILPMKSPCATE